MEFQCNNERAWQKNYKAVAFIKTVPLLGLLKNTGYPTVKNCSPLGARSGALFIRYLNSASYISILKNTSKEDKNKRFSVLSFQFN